MEVQHCTPQFPVADVPGTQAYYRDVLGFSINWTWEDTFGSVGNGEVEIFFSKQDDPQSGFGCYLFVQSADVTFEQHKSRGAKIIDEPCSRPWGMREYVLEDNNGHFLRIGHGEKKISDIKEFANVIK